ncbi:RHS repeat-associated core domain-containing protein [Pseudomonas sp. NFACC23-1]|uniref:RHS repeat-associated core domain-containing protein n=1 Tax=unclassified Pseudomonas TaxID=196821 RepID=UPI00088F113B|nr:MULTISPECIES: RHS repeat-associated core domain-containing protein [unclassified Pseudomonas]SDB47312.1 RHS repeat-associated core domain-containing protein [Pseudomonas sp. NFACC17-2]SEJ99136.1 RHS repeat-associated core domain-containing protein [Pseudomonas sp. NFACC23-1]SFW50903.1 RHS repeat-associated core domain-containing protein [Pseudomonas sp. NFACC16-2]
MSTVPNETVGCRYHYDPLDRLSDCAPMNAAAIQRFYCKSRLVTEIQGAVQRSVVQHDDQLLAQQQRQGSVANAILLATDLRRSVLHTLDAQTHQPLIYTPYGHLPAESGLTSLLGFNGERRDPVSGHYLLGNGYRAFNPVLMRFNSPDSLSPFGRGGLNAYVYCLGDPVNLEDRTGHMPLKCFPLFTRRPRTPTTVNQGIPVAQTSTTAPVTSNKASTPLSSASAPGSSSTLQAPRKSSQSSSTNPYPSIPEVFVEKWQSQGAFSFQIIDTQNYKTIEVVQITPTQRNTYDFLLLSDSMDISTLSEQIRQDFGLQKQENRLYMLSLDNVRPIDDFINIRR